MKKAVFLTLIGMLFLRCSPERSTALSSGSWLAHLETKDHKILPFNFELRSEGHDAYTMEIQNAEEVIVTDEIQITNDSITIRFPVFEGYLTGRFSNNRITGSFIKESLGREVPFAAVYGKTDRFPIGLSARTNVSGVWETIFSPDSEERYMAKGIFEQTGSRVTGTFRTTTGDYRYLEGTLDGDSLKLSTFDGAHAFLFLGKAGDSTLRGTFYSGNHFSEPFVAKKNPTFELPNEDSLTFLKKGYDRLAFSFPDRHGKLVSLEDKDFKDKVVIVQIMGTWCPNCLDETKFLVNYLQENNTKDLKIVALAFEYAKNRELAFKSIDRLRERVGVTYPILLAQYGTSNKTKAQEKLPMLNHVLSYPTTIFIDKKGAVRKIHTGFNGPATGEKYELFKKEFQNFVQMLLEE